MIEYLKQIASPEADKCFHNKLKCLKENARMERQSINDRYITLCKEHGITLTVANTDAVEAPAYELSTNHLFYSIVLNDSKIDTSRYESFLAYAVSKLLLPRLVRKPTVCL